MRPVTPAIALGLALLGIAAVDTLAQESLVQGFVAATAGQPIAGARVSAITVDQTGHAQIVRTQTDAAGSFTLQAPSSNGLLVVEAVGYITVRKPLSPGTATGPLSIKLSGAASVSGRVVDESTGRPLVAAVTAIQVSPDVVTQTVWADSAGSFAVGGLGPGDLTLLARADEPSRSRSCVDSTADAASAGMYVGWHQEPPDDARFENGRPAIGGWFACGSGRWQIQVDATVGALNSTEEPLGFSNGAPVIVRYSHRLVNGTLSATRKLGAKAPVRPYLRVGAGVLAMTSTFRTLTQTGSTGHVPRDEVQWVVAGVTGAGLDVRIGRRFFLRTEYDLEIGLPYGVIVLHRLVAGTGLTF